MASLLIENMRLIKTTKLCNPVYIGDALNAVKILSDKNVSEIAIIDRGSSLRKNKIDFDYLANLASVSLVPMSYGGGLLSLTDAKELISIGYDKIIIRSGIFENRYLIDECVSLLGSQSVGVALDIRYNKFSNQPYELIFNGGVAKFCDIELINFINELDRQRIGELILHFFEHDGLRNGFNSKLVVEIRKLINRPILLMGGIGSLDHIKLAFNLGCNGVYCGSFFCQYGPMLAPLITYLTDDEIDSLSRVY